MIVEECGTHLRKWNKEVYMETHNRLGWLLKRLKKVRKMVPTHTVIEELRKVEHELCQLR